MLWGTERLRLRGALRGAAASSARSSGTLIAARSCGGERSRRGAKKASEVSGRFFLCFELQELALLCANAERESARCREMARRSNTHTRTGACGREVAGSNPLLL